MLYPLNGKAAVEYDKASKKTLFLLPPSEIQQGLFEFLNSVLYGVELHKVLDVGKNDKFNETIEMIKNGKFNETIDVSVLWSTS